MRAAGVQCSVKVSCTVQNHVAVGRKSAQPSGEGVDCRLVPASAAVRRKLKYGSIPRLPVYQYSRPVEVAATVGGGAGKRIMAIAASGEVLEHRLSLGRRCVSAKHTSQRTQ